MKKINKRSSYLSIDDYLEIKIREAKLRNKEWEKQQRQLDKKFKQIMDSMDHLKEKMRDNHLERIILLNTKCNCEDHQLIEGKRHSGKRSVTNI